MGSWILLIDFGLGMEFRSRVPPKKKTGMMDLPEDYSTEKFAGF